MWKDCRQQTILENPSWSVNQATRHKIPWLPLRIGHDISTLWMMLAKFGYGFWKVVNSQWYNNTEGLPKALIAPTNYC
jgi:hypothetical protein